MFRNKSVVLVMLIAVMLVLSLSMVNAQDDPTTIRISTPSGPPVEPAVDLMIEAFSNKYPDITVEKEYLSGDWPLLYTTQAAAGTLPDVVFLADLFVVNFAENGIVLDMTSFTETDDEFDLSDVYENMLDLSRVNGEGLYMVPSAYDVVTMYYNITMFEEAGAPLPEADWTWDDFISACLTIRENLGNYCIQQDTFWWATFVPWIVGYGGSLVADDGVTITFNSEESLAGIEAYVGLWTEHDIMQPLDFDAGGDCFNVGQCATRLHIAGIMPGLRDLDPQPFEWDVQVIPTHPEGKVTGMGTYGFAISTSTDYPDIAWELTKGLLATETQIAIAQAYAGVPLLRSLREDPAIVDLPGPPDNITAFIENGENGITPPSFPAQGECGSLYAGLVNQEYQDALESAILGMMPVGDAMEFANENIQRCIDRALEE